MRVRRSTCYFPISEGLGLRRYGSTILAAVAAIWLSHAPLHAQTLYGTNLVVNGDAESSPGTPDGTPPATITGWTISGGPQVLRYADNGRLGISSIAPGNRGKNY